MMIMSPKPFDSYCSRQLANISDHVTWSSDYRVYWTIARLHQNDDNVAQAPVDFIKMMITLSKSLGVLRRFVQKGGELPTAFLALICRSWISRSACYSGCCERTFRILMATWHILDASARTVCKRAWSRIQSQQCSTSQYMLHPLSTLYLSG